MVDLGGEILKFAGKEWVINAFQFLSASLKQCPSSDVHPENLFVIFRPPSCNSYEHPGNFFALNKL